MEALTLNKYLVYGGDPNLTTLNIVTVNLIKNQSHYNFTTTPSYVQSIMHDVQYISIRDWKTLIIGRKSASYNAANCRRRRSSGNITGSGIIISGDDSNSGPWFSSCSGQAWLVIMFMRSADHLLSIFLVRAILVILVFSVVLALYLLLPSAIPANYQNFLILLAEENIQFTFC